ncbi:Astacin [Diplonema papillatum]|nr:Astacin [Diplonema papillatum]
MGKPLSHSVCVPPEVKKRWPIAVLTCICLGLLLLVEAEFSVTEPLVKSNCEVSCWIGTSLKQSPCALSEGIGCHTSTDLMNWKFLNETMHDTSIVSSVGTPPWWIERSDDQHGNDSEPIEVPLTRPTTITSVGWVAHEITNLCTTPPDGGDYDASRCDAPVGTFAATISDVPVATCLVVVRVAAGPTVVPTADAPSTAVPQYSQCLMDAGSAPDAILTHPRPPLFTLSDGPPQPPNLPTPADSNPAAYYLQDDDDRISWAVANWEEETCIRFTKCSSPFTCEEPFMVFVSDASRCDAPVGTSGCVSEVNIRTIRYQGWVAHVTAHALGLSRENTRNDRDGYVTLNESNIWSKSERAADRCRAIADGAAFRRGRGEEDGFVEFHSEGHLQPVVHEAPVVVRARVAPRGAKLLEVAGSFSTNFAATISDVSVATCSVVARMAAGTTDAPPSAVPQTAAPAPCTWYVQCFVNAGSTPSALIRPSENCHNRPAYCAAGTLNVNRSPWYSRCLPNSMVTDDERPYTAHPPETAHSSPLGADGRYEHEHRGSFPAVGCREDRPRTRPSAITATDTVWSPQDQRPVLSDLTNAIVAPCLPGLPQPPRSVLRSQSARQRRLQRAADRRRSARRGLCATLSGNVLVIHSCAPWFSFVSVAVARTTHTPALVTPPSPMATPDVSPPARCESSSSFIVTGVDGKRHCLTANLDDRLDDVLEGRGLLLCPGVRVVRGCGAPLPLDTPLREIGFDAGLSPSLSILPSVLGGKRSGFGSRQGQGRGIGSSGRPSVPSGRGSMAGVSGRGSGTVVHEVCGSKGRGKGQRPLERDDYGPSASSASASHSAVPGAVDGLYPGWEAPEARFRATMPMPDTPWSEVQQHAHALARTRLHWAVDRQEINGIWGVTADRELSKDSLNTFVRATFAVPAVLGEATLKSSGFGSVFFEPLANDHEYRVINLGEIPVNEAQDLASSIPDLHWGLTFCRAALGIRVKAADYKRAIAQLPPLPPPIGYFEVQGVPCRTNGGLLSRNLRDLGWGVTPLFRTRKGGRFLTWVVKSETLPGTDTLRTAQGPTLRFKRIPRCPLEPAQTDNSPRLSDSFRAPSATSASQPNSCSPPPLSLADLTRLHGAAVAQRIVDGLRLLGEQTEPPRGKPLAGGLTIAAADFPDDEPAMDVDAVSSSSEEVRPCSPPPAAPQPIPPPGTTDVSQTDALAAALGQFQALSAQMQAGYRDAVAKTEVDLLSGFRMISDEVYSKVAGLSEEIRAQGAALSSTRSELAADIQKRGAEMEGPFRDLAAAVRLQSVALDTLRGELPARGHDLDRRPKVVLRKKARDRSADHEAELCKGEATLPPQPETSSEQVSRTQVDLPVDSAEPLLQAPQPHDTPLPLVPPPATRSPSPAKPRSALKTGKGPNTKDTAERAARERSLLRKRSARPAVDPAPLPPTAEPPRPQCTPELRADQPQTPDPALATRATVAGRGRSPFAEYPPPRSRSAPESLTPQGPRGAGRSPASNATPPTGLLPQQQPSPPAGARSTEGGSLALPGDEPSFDGSLPDYSPPLLSQH